jgi:hypothetical protein
VGKVKCSDHLSIILEFEKGSGKPRAPFKFNPTWYDDEGFRQLVGYNCNHYQADVGTPESVQFVASLLKLKEKTIVWAWNHQLQQDQALRDVEATLEQLYNETDGSLYPIDDLEICRELEEQCSLLVLNQEKMWCLRAKLFGSW